MNAHQTRSSDWDHPGTDDVCWRRRGSVGAAAGSNEFGGGTAPIEPGETYDLAGRSRQRFCCFGTECRGRSRRIARHNHFRQQTSLRSWAFKRVIRSHAGPCADYWSDGRNTRRSRWIGLHSWRRREFRTSPSARVRKPWPSGVETRFHGQRALQARRGHIRSRLPWADPVIATREDLTIVRETKRVICSEAGTQEHVPWRQLTATRETV